MIDGLSPRGIADRLKLRAIAWLLDHDDHINGVVMCAIADARSAGPRLLDANGDPADVDSGDVVEGLIRSLRAVAA